jgi:1-acyl-sn-glycerol-3-phosphate acyltransferase
MAFALRKVLRRCTSKVTFDRISFERALEKAPADAFFVLAPTHRSYFDFLLTSYMCFQHPELGIPVPHIAAAEEFSRIPLVGDILRQARAFYIRRGVGHEVPEVSEELKRITAKEASLMFFVEGQRSRARRVLPPKRGLLRGLQSTGRTFAVLPIAVSYDRVPEERAFERELTGGARSRMSLTAILKWLAELARGEVQLGRVHLACGTPVVLDASTDVQLLAEQVVAEHQRHTVVTPFHLKTFLDANPIPGIDEVWLTAAIRRRGGRVLDSPLPAPQNPSLALRQSLQNQWMHWFYADALRLYPNSTVVRDHVERHGWVQPWAQDERDDERLRLVLDRLFHPVLTDYELVVKNLTGLPRPPPPQELVKKPPVWHLPHVEDAYQALLDQGVLIKNQAGELRWGPRAPKGIQ